MAVVPAPDYADEISKLEAGLGSGEARIESEGESVTYRGVADIMSALGYFRQRAASAAPQAYQTASTYAAFYPD
jgi:hypothetical protein